MSILSVDFGSVHTRAVLLDLVDGNYQLIARAKTRTTDGFPVGDVTVGLDRVLRELSDATGRNFTNGDGRIITPEQADRAGVDLFTATASLGRPLRAVVVGLMPNLSTASAIRAATGSYVTVAAQIHLDDRRNEQERINALLLSYPDVIIIAGGTESGAESPVIEMIGVVRLAISLIDAARRPTVIYVGNSALHPQITAAFDEVAPLMLAQNVRPTLSQEAIEATQARLGQAFNQYKEQHSPDFAEIAAMGEHGIQPTAQGYSTIINYMGRTQQANVLAVDVGGTTSTLAASVKGETTTTIRNTIGLGHNALNLFKSVNLSLIRQWLPFYQSDADLRNYAANKTLRPATIPATLRELYIEHALLRGAIQTLLESSRPTWKAPEARDFSVIIGSGAALTDTGNPAYSALLLLDAIQPTGITMLYSDPYALLPALGTIATSKPEAVVQMMDGSNLDSLGMSFNLSGNPRLDKPAFKVKITLEDGEVIEKTVEGGHIWVYPLPIGQSAEVRVQVIGRGVSLNGKRRRKIKLTGGSAGLIFDARGRPLPLASDLTIRALQMPAWVAEATGDPLQVIDPQWLEVPEAPITAPTPAAKAPRRGLFGRRRVASVDQPTDADLLLSDEEERDELSELRDASLS